MWLYVLMAFAGGAGVISGVLKAKKSRAKGWCLLTALGGVCDAAGIFLAVSALLLTGGTARG